MAIGSPGSRWRCRPGSVRDGAETEHRLRAVHFDAIPGFAHRIGADADGLHFKVLSKQCDCLSRGQGAEAGDEPMRRQDRQAGVAHADEHHEDKVRPDFLIATEAEMNKVSWTTRKRLVKDTIVVLVTVFPGIVTALPQALMGTAR